MSGFPVGGGFDGELTPEIICHQSNSRTQELLGSLVTGGAVASSAGVLFYEWGIGNETVTPIVIGKAAELSNALGGTVLATVAGTALVVGEQAFAAVASSVAINRAPRFTNWVSRKMGTDSTADEDSSRASWNELSLDEQISSSLTLGASFASIREKVINPKSSTWECIKQGLHSAKVAGCIVAGATLTLETTTRVAEQTDNIGPVDTDWLVSSANFLRDNMYDWRWYTLYGFLKLTKDFGPKLYNRIFKKTT